MASYDPGDRRPKIAYEDVEVGLVVRGSGTTRPRMPRAKEEKKAR